MPRGNNPIPNHVLNRRRNADSTQVSDAVYNDGDAVAAADIANIAVRPEHAREVIATEKNTIASFPVYRNMLEEIAAWMKREYPALYDTVVFEIDDGYDRTVDARHYYKAKHDFRYHLIQAKWIKAFISGEKKWKDEAKTKQYGFDHPRRYHDAFMKCAGVSDYQLHPTYKAEMKKFLDNMQKEKTKAKGKRQLDENEADPIGFGLYEQICKWAVESGTLLGIFIWAFICTQWNVMGRTVNVDPLGFHNLRKSQHDSVVIKYDDNKADKKGEKVTPKNIYSNPAKPFVSFNLALGCYLCLNQNKFKRDSDKIFLASGGEKSASNTFSKALNKLIKGKRDDEERRIRQGIVREHCRDGHFHPHGVRKGAGTHVTTCTMDPPPIPSVLMRGEWSLGKVLEVYWKWSTFLDIALVGTKAHSDQLNVWKAAGLLLRFLFNQLVSKD